MIRFNRSELPFSKKMKTNWDDNGFLVIENFYLNNECDILRNKAEMLVKNFDPKSVQSIFDTKNKNMLMINIF